MRGRIAPTSSRVRRALRVRFALGLVVTAAFYAATSDAGVAPEGDTTHLRAAVPGEIYRSVIVVRNSGATAADVKLYQTDYTFDADGRNDYGAPGKLPRSNAGWLRLGQEQVAIPASGRASIDYEVRVPDDAHLAGTYWSTVMVEEIPRTAPGQQLRQVVRYAIQMITEVGDTGRGEISFANAHLAHERDQLWFTVDIANTGERWLRTELWLELHDAQGRSVGRFSGRRLRTFPSTSVRNRIELTSVAPGKYLALLVADGGRNDMFGARLELEVP